MGDGLKFYQKFFWWDLLLHFIAGITFISIGLGIAKSKLPDMSFKHMLIFSFLFAITLHVFWELYEFTCDQTLDTNMQRWHFDPNMPDSYGKITNVKTPGVIDTMTDFIANILGAILICIGYWISKRKHN